jgi:hypothetical protein
LFLLRFVFLPRQLFFKSDPYGLECRGFCPSGFKMYVFGPFNINENTCYLFKKKKLCYIKFYLAIFATHHLFTPLDDCFIVLWPVLWLMHSVCIAIDWYFNRCTLVNWFWSFSTLISWINRISPRLTGTIGFSSCMKF